MSSKNTDFFTNHYAEGFFKEIHFWTDSQIRKYLNEKCRGITSSWMFDFPPLEQLAGYSQEKEITYGLLLAALRYTLLTGEYPNYLGDAPSEFTKIKNAFIYMAHEGMVNRYTWIDSAKTELSSYLWYMDSNILGSKPHSKEMKIAVRHLKTEINNLLIINRIKCLDAVQKELDTAARLAKVFFPTSAGSRKQW